MRISIIPMLLTFFVVASTTACGSLSDSSKSLPAGVVTIEYGYLEGKAIPFIITEQQIAGSPNWHYGQVLPLSIDQAVEVASKELAQDVGSANDWRLLAVRLERVCPCGSYTPSINIDLKWYYVVEFGAQSKAKQIGSTPNSFRIPVLLNGQTIRAQGIRRPS